MTRALAVVVPRERAEAFRRSLKDSGLVRPDLSTERTADEVAFPVRAEPLQLPEGARTEMREFAAAPHAPRGSYRDRVDLPPELREALPRAFDVIGEIVLVRLPPEAVPFGAKVGEALLETVPGARLVGRDRGVHGAERRRSLERLAGSGGWRTLYRENGLSFEVDVEAAYFSPRLAREHARVAAQVGFGERVFDLCCGVGPFALAIAARARAREIVAVDLNPRAVELLRANLARLRLTDRIRAVEADVGEFLPSAGTADRILLNLPHEGIKYLPLGLRATEPGGVLHYYEVTERADQAGRSKALVDMTDPRDGWTADPPHPVHPYSPRSDLVAYTLHRAPTREPNRCRSS